MASRLGSPWFLLLFSNLSVTVSKAFPTIISQPIDLNSTTVEAKHNSTELPNDSSLILPTAWPLLPWWTTLTSDPQAYLDVYSIGPPLSSLDAYILQETLLIPLSFRLNRGPDPASQPERISGGGLEVLYMPIEARAPGKDVAARAVAALAFFENKFGARTVEAGLRMGMVRVAGLEVRRMSVEEV